MGLEMTAERTPRVGHTPPRRPEVATFTFHPWTLDVAPQSDAQIWKPSATNTHRRASEADWDSPRLWNQLIGAGQRHGRAQVVCTPPGGLISPEVPTRWIEDLLALMAATPNLVWLVHSLDLENAQPLLAQAGLSLPNLAVLASRIPPNPSTDSNLS